MNNARKSVLGKCFWLVVVIACTVMGIRHLCSIGTGTGGGGHIGGEGIVSPPSVSPEDVKTLQTKRQKEMDAKKLELEKKKLRVDIEARHAKFRGDVDAIVEKSRKMLPLSVAEAHFKTAEEGADFIASREGLCGFKVCAVLAYKMAYDKVKKTNRTEEAIAPVVASHIEKPIEMAVKAYSDWAAKFQYELQKEEQAFSLDLALRSQKFKADISAIKTIDVTKINESIGRLVSDIQEHAKEAVFVSLGTVIEAIMIKSSYVAIKQMAVKIVIVALSSVSTKLGATAVAATGSAVADGPLPIGDIIGGVITIGGLTWTAYDIYKVTKTMPDEMKGGMMKAINESREALMRTGIDNLEKTRDDCLESADSRVKELYRVIGQEKSDE